MAKLKRSDIKSFKSNPFSDISDNWVLICAGKTSPNPMTASWGLLGTYYGKPCAAVFIRPSRHTHELVESENGFSVCYFGEDRKEEKNYCGKISGRDEDKMTRCGFTVSYHGDIPYIDQAETVLICEKIFRTDMLPEQFTSMIDLAKFYSSGDFHTLYIGEVTALYTRSADGED